MQDSNIVTDVLTVASAATVNTLTATVATQTTGTINNLTVATLATVKSLGGGVQNSGATSLAQTITNNATITNGAFRVHRVTATAACTSAALTAGTVDGQDLSLINVGATAITISTLSSPITTLAVTGAVAYVWDAGSTLWYHKA